ncbi:MAG TPA: carbonic anhydrase, partial [Acidimicrobiales bacterium]|nr:carbonic anhydrase [Acidimicrobiales bacterium]
MSATSDLLANNASYAAGFDKGHLPLPPAKKLAVLACMDARLDPAKALGLQEGDAHVIRNAGGVASEDALRSLVISQRLLGTEEIILIHHTESPWVTWRLHTLERKMELCQKRGFPEGRPRGATHRLRESKPSVWSA